ncbi:MAG: hypothetical protein V3R96_07805 [Dehalococcoidales bacterium]
MAKEIKCEKCDREFNEEEAREYPGKVHVHKGQVMCEDCLVDMGVMPDTADTYALYIETHPDFGMDR